MARTLYDLAAADDKRRFSPYCWRIKMALAHKGLEVETVPWRFTEKDAITFSGQGRVPVLVDGDKVVANSWAIANYLEDRYPDRKSLFGDASARSLTHFVASWADGVLQPAITQFILADIHTHLHEKDKVYFRRVAGTAFRHHTREVLRKSRRNSRSVSHYGARAAAASARIKPIPRRY